VAAEADVTATGRPFPSQALRIYLTAMPSGRSSGPTWEWAAWWRALLGLNRRQCRTCADQVCRPGKRSTLEKMEHLHKTKREASDYAIVG
jgi:hypothetical protein